MRPIAKLLFVYAAILLVCGVLGWASTGFTEKGRTAIVSGAGTAVIMTVLAFLANAKAKLPMMLGIHAGMIFPILFGATFIWRGTISFQDPSKFDTAILLSSMAAVSLVTFVLALRFRPSKAEREALT